MTTKSNYFRSLSGLDLSGTSIDELIGMFNETLNVGMHGLCFSPYLEGQSPGVEVSREQIRARMDIITPHTRWIRSFSCTDGNELIPEVAKENGLKTLVGAWLGKNRVKNDKEISNLIGLARAGFADIVAVGNEVLYRKDLTEDELLAYIHAVKKELPDSIVGYVDAYYEFCNRPAITAACDIILANCYPYWEGCDLEYSLLYMKDMYNRALVAGAGKKVIITETGWPNAGTNEDGAVPSDVNAIAYFINAQKWSKEDNVDMFYFSSFDEAWKTGDEGDVGAYWGLWNSQGCAKYIS